jgi:hypothetical protein
VSEQPILLKVLLGQRHWQNYATFCAEYDKAARRLDSDLGQTFPSRAQLHRWLSGSLRSLPYADHCRVLEEMLPGWSAEQLFQPSTPELLYAGGQSSGNGAAAPAGASGPPVFAAPSIGIRPFIEQAFAREHISIDFAGFSGETLHGVIQEPLDKIRLGQLVPESIDIRILIPDTRQPWAIPARVADLADEPAFRDRAELISKRHTDAITESVAELADLGLVKTAAAQVRVHGAVPMFKLYILNRAEAFFGFYPITEHAVTLHGEQVPMYDLMGKDATLFHYETGDDPTGVGAQYVAQAQAWFDSMWSTVSRDQAQ